MFLSKRKNGIYYLYYKDELTGIIKKISTKSKNKIEAQKYLINLKREKGTVNNGKLFTLISLNKFVLNYVENNFTKSTWQLYKRAFKEFIRVIGNKIAFDINLEDIELFKKTRLNSVSPVTTNIEIRTLKASYNIAKKFKYTEHNPFDNVTQIKEVQIEKMIFSDEEIQQLIYKVDNPILKSFILIGLYTGMRLAEILNLQWKDIVLKDKIIKVLNKENHRTKTTKIRAIPISEKLFPVLLNMKNKEMYHEEEYLFQSHTLKPYDKSFITRKFKSIVLKAGLPQHLHFHNLRHTFITQLLRKGISIYKVKVLAGHSSIKTTEGYAHLIVEDLRNAVNVL